MDDVKRYAIFAPRRFGRGVKLYVNRDYLLQHEAKEVIVDELKSVKELTDNAGQHTVKPTRYSYTSTR